MLVSVSETHFQYLLFVFSLQKSSTETHDFIYRCYTILKLHIKIYQLEKR